MQLKLALMEAVALDYSELSRWPKGCCPCFTDQLLFQAVQSINCFEEFFGKRDVLSQPVSLPQNTCR